MIRLVIEIPEEDYNKIEPFLNGETIKGGFNLFKALEIIKNGKPLPKGHGRLIDETKLEDIIHDKGFNSKFMNPIFTMTEVVDMMEDVPTVIEADEEEGAD